MQSLEEVSKIPEVLFGCDVMLLSALQGRELKDHLLGQIRTRVWPGFTLNTI